MVGRDDVEFSEGGPVDLGMELVDECELCLPVACGPPYVPPLLKGPELDIDEGSGKCPMISVNA